MCENLLKESENSSHPLIETELSELSNDENDEMIGVWTLAKCSTTGEEYYEWKYIINPTTSQCVCGEDAQNIMCEYHSCNNSTDEEEYYELSYIKK